MKNINPTQYHSIDLQNYTRQNTGQNIDIILPIPAQKLV
jgi:hypothetical protein